jgi:hypothetical protein
MRITGVVKLLSRLAVIGGISTVLAVPAAAETFTTIEYPGAMHTRLFGISPRGTIAGFYINPDGSFHGLLRSGEELTSFDFPGATFTGAIGINAAGAVVGFYGTSPGVFHGYLLSHGLFTTIDVPGAVSTCAVGTSRRPVIASAQGFCGATIRRARTARFSSFRQDSRFPSTRTPTT